MSRVTVHCIGNAHIDPVWRWRWNEGYTETLSTCRAAVDRMRDTPGFTFSRGQAATYAWIEENDPELFQTICALVREGRWHLVNGWWEQPDANIPSGESYVRHALYGKRWFRQKLGVDVTVGWNVDTFGHNAGLPQILAKSGFTCYVFYRPGRHEMTLPSPFFWWEAQDGSRVLGIRPPVGHYGDGGGELTDGLIRAAEEAQQRGWESAILLYGVGNHGGGPTKRSLASIRAAAEDPELPLAVCSSVEQFVESIRPHLDELPVVRCDLQHHARGCYTSHSEVKRLNRRAEDGLIRSEIWSALAARELGIQYPAGELDSAWKQVLFNQFHDIMAGTSLPAAYEDTRNTFGEALAIADRAENRALQALARAIDTRVDEAEPPQRSGTRPVLIFNPASWDRAEPLAVQWGWGPSPLEEGSVGSLTDETGAPVLFQYLHPDIFGDGMRIGFEAEVPACGWRVYRFNPQAPTPPVPDGAPEAGDNWLQNEFWRLEIDPSSGEMSRLLDRKRGVEVLSGPGCALLVMNDPGDTWGHDIASWRHEAGRFGSALVERGECGAVQASLVARTWFGKSTARQKFTLYRSSPRIDVELTADWHERHKLLKLSFPVAIRDGVLTFDAPYATQQRRASGEEEPGQRWLDLSGVATGRAGDVPYGVSLLNDSKYGFDCLGTDLRMTILRSPIYCFHDPAKPEPGKEYAYLDQGEQTVRYALLAHEGGWPDAGTQQQAYSLNNPLQFLFQYPHAGRLPARHSLLRVSPPTVQMAALKGAEEGGGLILRLFDAGGAGCPDARVTWLGGPDVVTALKPHELKTFRASGASVAEVNLLEQEGQLGRE